MELYDWMKNLRNTSTEEEIKKVISKVRKNLTGLTEERTCFIYSSYIYEELKNNHISSRIVSTKDLDYDYEHRFILVQDNNEEDSYFLIDLTFSQFDSDNVMFNNLLQNGYQKINNDLWPFYLSNVTRNNKEVQVSLSDIYFDIKSNPHKNK